MSLTSKGRLTGALDPETTDRITGKFLIHVTGEWVDLDMPYISHIWGNFWVGGVDYGIRLPGHFRNVIQLFSYETYIVDHAPVGHWSFEIEDSVDQDLSMVDDIAVVAINAAKLGDTVIHCQAGMNRSALVMSRVLQMNGFTPQESVDMIRERRTPYALVNPTFHRWTLENPVQRAGETKGQLSPQDLRDIPGRVQVRPGLPGILVQDLPEAPGRHLQRRRSRS